MKTWFTSDTHFGSERTLQLSKRPFKTVNEMDNVIITNWNNRVSEDDTVYHLGDFGDYEVRHKLNGKIILIKGNYEEMDNLNGVFSEVLNCCSIELNRKQVFLNHYPSKHHSDQFNLFGHVHKLCMIKQYGLNVGTDCHNFCPIDVETVKFYQNAIENHYDSNVFD